MCWPVASTAMDGFGLAAGRAELVAAVFVARRRAGALRAELREQFGQVAAGGHVGGAAHAREAMIRVIGASVRPLGEQPVPGDQAQDADGEGQREPAMPNGHVGISWGERGG